MIWALLRAGHRYYVRKNDTSASLTKMSALGHKRTFRSAIVMSALPQERTFEGEPGCPLRANDAASFSNSSQCGYNAVCGGNPGPSFNRRIFS